VKVRLYVEGGPKGTHADGLRRFKNSFKQHLLRLDPKLSTLDVSPCGSTEETIRDYARAVRECETNCLPVLLVDSDAPVSAAPPAQHLAPKLDSANIPKNARGNLFLMVQCMEAWLVTDQQALEKCFGVKARTVRFPPNPNIEAVSTKDILAALNSAAKDTPTRHYHKVRHSAEILAELRPEMVAQRSKHARALHEFLRESVRK
jgi:hypothetical protein